jgi:hypothetical protein
MAHCLVQDNKVVEEWVIRDEFAVLQDLGIDPIRIAAELLKKSPVLGTAMDAANSPVFAGRIADPSRKGISGPRPDRYRGSANDPRHVRDGLERTVLRQAGRLISPTPASARRFACGVSWGLLHFSSKS